MPKKKSGHQAGGHSTADHEEHLRLASIVKGVHAELKNKFRNSADDIEQIWKQHCENKATLSEYANAMHKLATQHWTKNTDTTCRIDWCRKVIGEYFRNGGLEKVLEKEERRKRFELAGKEDLRETSFAEINASHYHKVCIPLEEPILLLDVGSCFNPFSEFDEFHAVGIDISPAVESVYECDFLNLKIIEDDPHLDTDISAFLTSLENPVVSLPSCYFHVVVFSLILEYLPAPQQRWRCCQNAQKLLKFNGILIIITPDSHKQHRNAPLMKNWKTAVESIGFKRWRYVKLEHLHCMVFRKTMQTGGFDESEKYIELLKVHQDFHENEEETAEAELPCGCTDSKACQIDKVNVDMQQTLLHELPLIGASGDDFT